MFRTKAGRYELLITKVKVNNGIIMFYVNSKKQWYYYEDLGESKWYADQLIIFILMSMVQVLLLVILLNTPLDFLILIQNGQNKLVNYVLDRR